MDIQLYNSPLFVTIDDRDYSLISQYNWYYNPEGYAMTRKTIDGKRTTIWMHRLIMGAQPGQKIDHRDGNGLNNQRSNLRFATAAENMQNRRKQQKAATSKYKGVYWFRPGGKWIARIYFNRKNIHLGLFENEMEAAQAYDTKARELYGDFAHLNFNQ